MTPLSEIWDYADRALLEELCHAAKVNPDLSNQPWCRLSDDAKERLESVYRTRKEMA